MKHFSLPCIVILLLAANLFAQGPDTLWTKTYGGIEGDAGYSVCQTSDGGYIITGYSNSFPPGPREVYLVKVDSLGDALWTRTYGGINGDAGYSVCQTSDGGYIITGYTTVTASNSDVYLIKTDSIGDTMWTRAYGGDINDGGLSVKETIDNGYIITGYKDSYSTSRDVYLIKTNLNGDTLWTKTFGGSEGDIGSSVQQTSDSGYIITGFTGSFGAGSSDVYLIKTNLNGDALWTKTFGGSELDIGNSVQQTFDDGYIIAGYTGSFGAGGFDVYLIKTNLNGDTLWTKTFGGYDWDVGYSVQQTFDGGYIIAGKTESFGAGGYDAYLIKTDSLGDTLWTRTYGGLDVEEGRSVQVTSDAGCIITGYTGSFGAGSWDVYLIRLAGIVDTIPPDSFNLISPLDSSILSITKPCFVWGASSDSNGIKNYEVYIAETLRVSLSDTTWTADYDLSEGFHNWYVVAYDMFDNLTQSNQIWAVGIDTTPPSIDSTTQWQDTSYAGPFEIRTKITDNFAGLDLVLLYYKRDEDSNWLTEVMHSSGNWFTDTIPSVSLPHDTVRYYIRAIDKADPGNESTDPAGAPVNYYSFIANMVGVEESSEEPDKFDFKVNSFGKCEAIFRFSIPEKSRITLKVYDMTGRVISTPALGIYCIGYYNVSFKPASSGIYFYKFESSYMKKSGKIIIFRGRND